MDATEGGRAELYVRSLAPTGAAGRQARVIDRLRGLQGNGQLAGLRVSVWGEQVGLSTTAARTETGQHLLEQVEACRSWAAAADRSVEPFFEKRECGSCITDEEYTALRLPMMLLAEYRGGGLAHVAPHQRPDGSVCSINDRLSTLEGGADGKPALSTEAVVSKPGGSIDTEDRGPGEPSPVEQ